MRTYAGGAPSDDQITLPRDNPVKDFLISTDQKFSDFGEVEGANVLVIVWDDFVYEPITSLINEKTGLLTENSYYKDEDGFTVEFSNIDGVIVVRHLSYFYEGLAGRELPDRHGIFDFGGHDSLPNVFFPTRWGKKVPCFIIDSLRALDYRSKVFERTAEYKPLEMVMWI